MTRRRRIGLVLGGFVLLFVAYEVVTRVIAYTGDAYVRSDLVGVAPQVTGRIIAVHVVDNQTVKRGDPLVSIDPVPFQLVVAQKQAEVEAARAQVEADQQAIAVAQDAYAAANAAAEYARDTQRRSASLGASGDLSRENLDRANEELRVANSAVESATADVAKSRSLAALHQSLQAHAEAELATAQWQLARTHIEAPSDGTINALTVQAGDTAQENQPLIGIVDAHAWRIMANYKQSYIRGFKVGGTAWVWLDSQPWHLHRGRIAGVARGISRDPDAEKLLPYVAPTTDWIRLQRRFPVTVTLEDAGSLPLFMGADARVVIFP